MLQELSLAQNEISDSGAQKISQFLDASGNSLSVLNLHWNKIKFKGGLRLAEVIENNNKLKILDLSWNLMGQWSPQHYGRMSVANILKTLKNQPQQSAGEAYQKLNEQETIQMEESIGKTWGRALKNNKALVHLDLSNNMFSEQACKLIGKRIVKNHTLFGLHMVGNCCSVDSLGFIVIDEAITAAFLQL